MRPGHAEARMLKALKAYGNGTGTVTRTSEVRPELFTGCFRCLECGTLVRDVEQQFKFTEPLMCTQTACQNK